MLGRFVFRHQCMHPKYCASFRNQLKSLSPKLWLNMWNLYFSKSEKMEFGSLVFGRQCMHEIDSASFRNQQKSHSPTPPKPCHIHQANWSAASSSSLQPFWCWQITGQRSANKAKRVPITREVTGQNGILVIERDYRLRFSITARWA